MLKIIIFTDCSRLDSGDGECSGAVTECLRCLSGIHEMLGSNHLGVNIVCGFSPSEETIN